MKLTQTYRSKLTPEYVAAHPPGEVFINPRTIEAIKVEVDYIAVFTVSPDQEGGGTMWCIAKTEENIEKIQRWQDSVTAQWERRL